MVGAELKRERALEPHRLGRLLAQTGVVAQSAARAFAMQLEVGLAFAEAAAAPACSSSSSICLERLVGAGVVALEHLVDDDPEALVEGLRGGDPQDAGELVAQRAAR